MTVVAYVVDLMDRSKMKADDREVTFVRSPAGLVDAVDQRGATKVVVDLGRPDAIEAIAAVAGRAEVVAYGSHVDTERLEEAGRAGAATVLARSAFFADPAGWLQG